MPDRGHNHAGRLSKPPRDEPIRQFRDEFGFVWTVREVVPDYDRRGRSTLIFTNEMTLTMRRVRDYPSDWRELTDAELQRLSWRK